ncbi:hypothetical protein ACFL4D_00680 [Candidatus Margulisiibacteriota bacterium]
MQPKRKDTKTLLLDEILESVSQKKGVVKLLPADISELGKVYEILNMDKSGAKEQAQSVKLNRPIVKPELKTKVIHKKAAPKANKRGNKAPLNEFCYRFLLGIAEGLGVIAAMAIVGVLGFIIITDLLGIEAVQSYLRPVLNWLRAAFA